MSIRRDAGTAADDERATRAFPAIDPYRRRGRTPYRRSPGEPVTGETR